MDEDDAAIHQAVDLVYRAVDQAEQHAHVGDDESTKYFEWMLETARSLKKFADIHHPKL